MDELLEANLIWLVNNGEIHEQSMRVAFFRLVKILSEYSSIFEAVISKLENPLTWWLSSTASSDEAIACLPALERSCDLLQSFVNELECFEFDDESEEKLQIIIEVLRKKDITDVPQGALFLWSKQTSIFGDKFLEVLLSANNAAESISTDLRHVFDKLEEDEFLLKLEKIRTFSTDNIQTTVRDEINSWEDSFKLFTNCSEIKMNSALQILSTTPNFNQNAEEFVQEAVNEHKIINLLQFIERTDRLNIISNPLSLAFKRAELIQQASVTLFLDENQSENYNQFFDEIATGEQISRAFESAEILRDQQIGSFLKTELQKRIRLSAAVKAEKEPEKLVKLILENSNEELEISNFFNDHEETGRAPDVEDILILSNLVSDKENLVAYLLRSVDSSFSWGISNITSDNSPKLVPLILGSSKGIQKEIIKFFSEESIISSFEENLNDKIERSAVEESIINFHKELPSNLTSFFTKTIFAKIIEDKQEDWMESKLGELALSIFDNSTPAMELKMSFTALINRHGGNFGTMKRIFDQLKKKHLSEIIGDMVLAEKFLIKYIEIVLLSSFVGDNKDSSVMERILQLQPDFFTRKERSIAFTSQNKRTKSSKIFSKFGDSGGKPGVFLRTNEDIELRNHDPLALLLKQTVCSHFHLSEEKEENSELPIVPLESILGVGKMSFVTIGRVTCEEELAKLKVKNIKGSVLKVFVEPYSRSSMLKLDEKSVEKFLEPLSGVKFSDIGGTTRGFVLQTKFDLNLGQFLENKGWIFKEDAPTLESRVFMLKKILEAIDYLHENKIFHLNLKPSNVLITQDLAGRKTALDVCVRDLR
ncbi:unnamed protein product [Oikopleura dioica]|uniref:Protein kinase domain-containing protein n=1 Tax=Oikopleura dioica TaxID=34765 RepID=E4WYH2_OIKDI|nr:unnamed protein product [Oikopleura dioica]